MAEYVSDCPRCNAKLVTHDVYSSVVVSLSYGWMEFIEIACICRACRRLNTQIVSKKESDNRFSKFFGAVGSVNFLASFNGSINALVKFERWITIVDRNIEEVPDHLPVKIALVFNEANRCVSSGCWNAAGAMYRLALDMATKELLPDEGEPSDHVKRSLGLRTAWLFSNNKLAPELKELANCLREDGNDGAHDGSLTQADAEDLHDFAKMLLERVYTEPERLKLATARRIDRRKGT